jgi:hypothetical protein|eukprot:COSAG02_NODE_3498_length_6650_cov_10.592581_1_plen_314_part_00
MAEKKGAEGGTLKVLYLHGYSEQVSGKEISPKPGSLIAREDLDVHAPELLVWVTQWNSPLWQVLATPYFHFAVFCAICAGEVVVKHGHFTPETGLRLSLTRLPPVQWVSNATGIDVPLCFDDMWVPPVFWLGLLVIVVVVIIFRTEIMTMAVDRSVNTTYGIAKNAVARHKPDVVVGFDWGAGLVFNLLREGVWDGPTIMVSPTQDVMWYKQTKAKPTMWHLELKRPKQVLVVHATDDPISDFKEAKATYEANNFTLEAITSRRHDMQILAKDGRLANMVHAVHQIAENLKKDDQDDEPHTDEEGEEEQGTST